MISMDACVCRVSTRKGGGERGRGREGERERGGKGESKCLTIND